jgi:hypothetical protein
MTIMRKFILFVLTLVAVASCSTNNDSPGLDRAPQTSSQQANVGTVNRTLFFAVFSGRPPRAT